MFFWLLSACLGLLPGKDPLVFITNPISIPAPIILPTTTTTTTPLPGTTLPGNMAVTAGLRPNNMTSLTPMMPTNTAGMQPMMPNNMAGMQPMMPNNMAGMQPMNGIMPMGGMPPMMPGMMGSNGMQPGGQFPPPNPGTNPFGNQPTNPGFNQPFNNQPNTGGFNMAGILAGPTNIRPLAQLNELCSPFRVCLANPNSVVTAPAIDPRLGTTPRSLSMVAASGSAVKFPRQKRSVRKPRIKRQTMTNCVCAPAGTCPTNSQGNFGNGFIDFRIVTPGATLPPGVTCAPGLVYCCIGTAGPASTVNCGVVQQAPSAPNVTPGPGQANFGEFPWQAMILTAQNDYIAGGVLIDQSNVLTVIHRLQPYIISGTAPNLKVRLGEWDAAVANEPIPFQEYRILKVFTHPMYQAATLQYDIAVLRLTMAVPLTPAVGSAVTINRACLPVSSAATFVGQRCLVAGWGKNAFGTPGLYQQILKKVQVPVVSPTTCQASLRAARLGPNYILDTTSFICAGGEVNMDACTGDGGSGLVCSMNGQWTLVGLVAWGLNCAQPGVPGVYVNIAALSDWIKQQAAAA